jgi:hypothetical protein
LREIVRQLEEEWVFHSGFLMSMKKRF